MRLGLSVSLKSNDCKKEKLSLVDKKKKRKTVPSAVIHS